MQLFIQITILINQNQLCVSQNVAFSIRLNGIIHDISPIFNPCTLRPAPHILFCTYLSKTLTLNIIKIPQFYNKHLLINAFMIQCKSYCLLKSTVGETLIFKYTLLKNYDLLAFYSWTWAKSTLSTMLEKRLKTRL